ncbi:MarR family winged helix-turn-helix transcriptional regulator, partial [Staphylococcus aureus]|uniref:MarR family winged helix-turn-helix transcriptional regulator n=1 Tax=Staphylococcus aureus TaxID=1280 RepID=UPI00403F12DA
NGYSDNILVKLFISEIVHTEDSFLLKLYYKFNFATEPKREWIIRIKVANDKRSNYVQLTDKGLKKLKAFLPYNYEIVSSIFDNFSEDEKEQLYYLANKLKINLEKDDFL